MTDGPVDTWTLLRRVGLTPTGGSLDALTNPPALHELARRLADRLAGTTVDLVVAWEGLHTSILGYAVGAECSATVALLSDDEGLVVSTPTIRPGREAVLVAPLTPDSQTIRMTASFLASQGATLSTVAALLGHPGDPVDTITLATLPAAETSSSELSGPADKPTPPGRPRPSAPQDRR